MDSRVRNKLDKFFSKHKLLKYRKNELLIRVDDLPLGIFYLKEGLIREYDTRANAEDLTLNIYKPPAIFPLSYAINNTIPSRFFEAVIPSTLFRAPKEDVLEFVKKEPEILYDLISRIYRGLEGLFKRMEYLMAGNAQARLITELLIYAKRFGLKQNEGIMINLKLTQKDLAAQSGIARETVGRILKNLKDKGLISFKERRFFVSDLVKLEEELF